MVNLYQPACDTHVPQRELKVKAHLPHLVQRLTSLPSFLAAPTKHVLAPALLLWFVIVLPCRAQETLRVLCYNIHYGQGTDGEYDLERLANVIKESQPDLVALQEVDVEVKRSGRVHEARRLAELTGMAVRFGPTQHYQGGLYGNAVLTRYQILDVAIHALPYTESTAELMTYPRGAIAVTVRTPAGQPLRFISTHFQHNLAEDRLAEAQAINRLFARDTDTIPTILAGDMNATPEAEPVQVLLKQWTNAIDDPPTPSAPATAPHSRIDYIFYRPADQFRLLQTRVVDEPLASDHCPVFAEFTLLPSP